MARELDRCRAAVRWFERFHGEPPKPGQVRFDRALGCLAEIGAVDTLTYATRRKKRDERREHEFAEGSEPRVWRTERGRAHFDGGRYRVSSQRGFVDMGAKKKSGTKKKAKRNPFLSGSDADLMTYAERVGITGTAAVAANVVTKVAANKYLDEWEPKTRNYARGAGQIYAGWKFRRKYPRIAAGVSIGGAIVLAEQFLTSSDANGFDLEREVNGFLNPPPAANRPAGVRQVDDGIRVRDVRERERERVA